jgi:hypothetical protein
LAAAIIGNPQLQEMMKDPEAMQKIMAGKEQAEGISAAQA